MTVIRVELTSMPIRRWIVTVDPDGLPWMGTTVVLTDEEMGALVEEVGRVRNGQQEPGESGE